MERCSKMILTLNTDCVTGLLAHSGCTRLTHPIREVISRDIGRWLLDHHHAPWPDGEPPKFQVDRHGKARFRVASKIGV